MYGFGEEMVKDARYLPASEIPLILQGAATREHLNEKSSLAQFLPLALGLVAAFFFVKGKSGRALWCLLLLCVGSLSAQKFQTNSTYHGVPVTVWGKGVNVTIDSVTNRVIPIPLGKPYGPSALMSGTGWQFGPAPFNFTIGPGSPGRITDAMNTARTFKVRIGYALCGGSHDQYITNGKFDLKKWKKCMDGYNTVPIKAVVAAAVADSTLLWNVLQDEPHHSSWGGVMTKPLLDTMSMYSKSIFPTLLTEVAQSDMNWFKNVSYHNVDVMQPQYTIWKGKLSDWIDSAVAIAKRTNVILSVSMNILDGGKRVAGCPKPQTGGPGTDPTKPNCRMNPQDVDTIGVRLVSVPQACILMMWRYDDVFFAVAANVASFNHVATVAKQQPWICKKAA